MVDDTCMTPTFPCHSAHLSFKPAQHNDQAAVSEKSEYSLMSFVLSSYSNLSHQSVFLPSSLFSALPDRFFVCGGDPKSSLSRPIAWINVNNISKVTPMFTTVLPFQT